MKRDALTVILLGALVLLGDAVLPPGRAAAQPQPTMVLSPASGPCDATVEVTGQDFPANAAIELGLTISGGGPTKLPGVASTVTGPSGDFAVTVALSFLGCEAASLDGFGPVSGQVLVVAQPPSGPLAQAPYSYTTRSVAEPGPMLTISPSTGECDATLQLAGQHFPRGGDIVLDVGRPHSEGALGTLGTVAATSSGDFTTTASLGPLGCQAAALNSRQNGPGEPNDLFICADIAGTPNPPTLTCATYTYTTTTVSTGGGSPSALPSAGQGGTSSGMDSRRLAALAALLGASLLAGGLLAARRRSS